MRSFLGLALIAACGSQPPPTHAPTPSPFTAEFSALRWMPDHPTYILAARTTRDAQRAIADLANSIGLPIGDAAMLGAALHQVLQLDPLSADIASTLGVDLAGGFTAFSEDINPTLVVHLGAPEITRAFFEQLRERGMKTRSVIVDGAEINTAQLAQGIEISWAIDHDWLWVHVALDPDPTTAWFGHAHHAAQPGWTEGFTWARRLAGKVASHVPGVVGFLDAHAMLGRLLAANGRGPDPVGVAREIVACSSAFAPIGRVAIAIDGDDHHVGGRLAIDLGPAARGIVSHLHAPPPGLDAASSSAPLALQWNLDLGAFVAWISPCAALGSFKPDALTKYGIETARATLLTFDPDHLSGTGVASADLGSKQFAASMLDQIPHRSMFESSHTFGSHAGHRLSIPFVIAFDYILEDHVAMAAVGDGLLDKLVMGAPASTARVFSFDIRPPGLGVPAWQFLLEQAFGARNGRRIVEHLMQWREGHIAVSIDGDDLVLEASGNRR